MLACSGNLGDHRVVVRDLGAAPFEELHDAQSRALARVVDVPLVSDTENQDLRVPGHAGSVIVESFDRAIDDALRHGRVDLAGQFDEAGGDAILPRLPCQVEGVDGNTVPAEARSR